MCIAARRGVDRSIGAVSVSRLLAMLYPAEGNLVPGNHKIAQHLIKGRAGRELIRVRVSVERHRSPPLQKPACSCFLSLCGSCNAYLSGRFPCTIIKGLRAADEERGGVDSAALIVTADTNQ